MHHCLQVQLQNRKRLKGTNTTAFILHCKYDRRLKFPICNPQNLIVAPAYYYCLAKNTNCTHEGELRQYKEVP